VNILITSGATREPIDDVRFITNLSSGMTGAVIADAFQEAGFDVILLAGESAKEPSKVESVLRFQSFEDLNSKLQDALREKMFSAVIHLAAVSDYSINYVQIGGDRQKAPLNNKLNSDQDVSLGLRKNFKILDNIKSYSSEPLKTLIGFKLTSTLDFKERANQISKLFESGTVDYVVHNDLLDMKNSGLHHFEIFHQGQRIKSGESKQELAKQLISIVRSHL
jgi:phosphopantothenoylcysteine synthetase/decarboxylase